MRARVLLLFSLIGTCSFPPLFALPGGEGEHGYQVGVGDLLDVETYQQEEISGEFIVEDTGAIIFPLLGPVQVADMTTAEIADRLESLLEKDFYVDVQVKVEVVEYASQPVTLLGEVQQPGTFYLRGKTTLTQILAEAGGLKPTAGPLLELRRLVDGEEGEKPAVFAFPTAKLRTGEEGRNVVVLAGDVISVSAKKLYFITGEVARPGQYKISLGMTLMQALSQAGGPAKFASQAVEVHREVGGSKEILNFDLSHIRKGRIADPAILAGDVIIVKRRFF
ncbi:MAG: SLBB domain-containing protein [Thermoanaerobaculales bacterium]